jgi:hypothetical protein
MYGVTNSIALQAIPCGIRIIIFMRFTSDKSDKFVSLILAKYDFLPFRFPYLSAKKIVRHDSV